MFSINIELTLDCEEQVDDFELLELIENTLKDLSYDENVIEQIGGQFHVTDINF